VTVAGEGGIGKTALAVQTLYDLVDTPECPYDAVLWASLKTERLTGRGIQEIRDAAFDVMSIAGELSSAIGESANTDIHILAEVLGDTPTLIATDNVESVGSAEIRELITALPECKFLLTSRVGLGEIEWRVTLDALGPVAAKIMLRQLANRRSIHQLARMSDRQADVVVDQLRRSPLAIRWFVEAVHAGGQPDDLLRDQSAVLQFSMSTIYDSLADAGRKLVDTLLALDASAGIGELALLTGLDRDEVVEQIYELQRRAVVHVERSLSETLSQSYALSDMARQYLERFGTLDSGFAEQIRKRLREIAVSDEITQRFEGRAIHIPEAIAAETSEERAVADVLRHALRKSKSGDLAAARELIVRARDAVPGYFESYRVSAFIESDTRPEEARRQYAEAYRLAPERHRPKVAYWLAGHLMRNLMAPAEAERYAQEAHDALALPETALRLGRVLMYQQRFDEAEAFLEAGSQAEYGRTRAIAETDLLDLAKRRAERLMEVERQPAAALNVALAGLERGWRFAASGLPDRRFFDALAELVAESLLVALRAPDIGELEEPLTELLEGIDRHFVVLSRPGLRDLWQSRVERLCARGDCPSDLVLYGEKLATRLDRQLERSKQGLESGIVLEYSAKKGYGFIRPVDGGDNIFFHRTGVSDPQDRFLLVRGAEVTYVPREAPHNGEMRLRAEQMSVARPEVEREREFRRRRGIVVHMTETFLFAEDIPTQERIFVHRSSFRSPEEWKATRTGSVVALDLEFNAQGAKAVSGSVLTDPGDH
jgi:cold shock CspA family protein/predicted transcriptional regulator